MDDRSAATGAGIHGWAVAGVTAVTALLAAAVRFAGRTRETLAAPASPRNPRTIRTEWKPGEAVRSLELCVLHKRGLGYKKKERGGNRGSGARSLRLCRQ